MAVGIRVFDLTAYDAKALIPQISAALEKMTEDRSKESLPRLWKAIDALGGSKPRAQASPRTRVLSIVCLALGIFLFVPGLTDPQGLLVPLLAGAAGVGAGIGGLIRNRKAKSSSFDKAAATLLSHMNKAVQENNGVSVAFNERELTISADVDSQTIPYAKVEHALETPDAFLIVFAERIMVLQKKDLLDGDIEGFRAFTRNLLS